MCTIRNVPSVRSGDAPRSPPPRSRSGSPRRAGPRAGELRQQPPHGLRCAHHDRGGRSELLAHPRQVAPAVEGARVHHHLVQRPRVAEVGYPRLAEPARELGAGVRGVVGLHPDVDQVHVTRSAHAQLRAAVDPPPRPARAEEEPALRASAPARGPFGLRGRGQAMHLQLRRNLGNERLVLGRPPVRGRTAAGHDDRIPAELVQEASHAAGAAARPSLRSAGSGTSGRGSALGRPRPPGDAIKGRERSPMVESRRDADSSFSRALAKTPAGSWRSRQRLRS